MERNLLENNFMKVDCVYSKKKDELIPLFKLKAELEDDVDLNKLLKESGDIYVEYYSYPETGERFDIGSEVITECYYDLVRGTVKEAETVMITDEWVNDSLIGTKVLVDSPSDSMNSKRVKLLLTVESINYEGIGVRHVSFIKRSNLEKYLKECGKRIVKTTVENKDAELIKLVERYSTCKLKDHPREETICLLEFIKE